MTGFSELDSVMMAGAIRQARKGLFTTQPNPRVGCVLAHGDTVIGAGFHASAGGPHAEIVALEAAGDRARGATAYVTLEPCCHTGRTGPCTEALIEAGIARVVYAHEDPNPAVAGQGGARLEAAGITVQGGLMSEEARALNPGYLMRIECGRPFVRCKVAVSLDGRTALASGDSKWITGEAAREDVQRWRARSSAIMTGIGTVLADDPRLDLRQDPRPAGVQAALVQPARVVLDSRLRIAADARIFKTGGPVHVFTAEEGSGPAGACVHRVPGAAGGVELGSVMSALAALEINELLVEAGATLTGALLCAGLMDELLLYQAPHLLGEGARSLAVIGMVEDMARRPEFTISEVTRFGEDLRLRLKPARSRGRD